MKRRGVLIAASSSFALGGCLGGAADATGPRTPPTAREGGVGGSTSEPDLYLRSFDAEEGAGGDVRVVGTVANRAGVRRTGTVKATVTVGGETHANATAVTVDPDGETQFRIPFDVAYETFAGEGDVSVSVTS